jgi:hypothetical protein
MAVPGETACREIAPCGDGAWGDIPVDGTTQFVDVAYAGGNSDGSAARPWTSIQDAVTAVEPGAIVALAAGSYVEDVSVVGKRVRVWGRCPAMVELVGSAAGHAAIYIRSGAHGTELRDVAVRGATRAVLVSGALDVVLDRLWIHDTGLRGLLLQNDYGPTSVVVSRSLVEAAHDLGMFLGASDVVLESTVVRNTLSGAGEAGRGVGVQPNPFTAERAHVTVRGSLIEHNRELGLFVTGSDLSLESTVVRDTLLDEQGFTGRGIGIQADPETDQRANAVIVASVLERNHETGVFVEGADVRIEATVVRDTQPDVLMGSGWGMSIQNHRQMSLRGRAALRHTVVERNQGVGMLLYASDGTLDAVAVRDTAPDAEGWYGQGLAIGSDSAADERASVTVRGSVVERNHEAAVVVSAADATLEATALGDTRLNPLYGFADGLVTVSEPESRAQVQLTDGVVRDCARAGVVSFGSAIALARTRFDCNAIHLDGESDYAGLGQPVSLPYTFDDRGGNVCGCDAQREDCVVLSVGLDPPGPIE